MSKAPLTTRATRALRAAIAALEADGAHTVKAIRIHASGAIDLLTEAPESPSLSDPHGDWTDLAGAPEIHRA